MLGELLDGVATVEKDALAAVDGGAGCFLTVGDGKVLFPWGATEKLRRIDATSPEDLSWAQLECRRRVMEVMDRLRREVPGFARASLSQVADQLGITESRRLQGRSVLTREDLDASFEDAIATTGHWTKAGVTYSIPFRCLLPRELDNLLVAGRCISVDHRVHHATNPRYLDANYAGTLVIWDRMFGTFVPELDEEPCRYGLVKNIGTFNPIRVAAHEWVAMWTDAVQPGLTLGQRLRYLFAAPGWSHDGSRQTSAMIKAGFVARNPEEAGKPGLPGVAA